MRKTRFGLVILAVLAGSTQAQAQFANRRIGLEIGAMKFTDRELQVGLQALLEGTVYIENGFDVGLRVPFVLFLTNVSSKQRFGTGGQLYFRYLFSEESFRPYAGAQIDVLVIIREAGADGTTSGNQTVFWGPGLFGGLDYFVGDTVSIGARAFFTLYIALNNAQAIRPSGGGAANLSFYF